MRIVKISTIGLDWQSSRVDDIDILDGIAQIIRFLFTLVLVII